MPRLLGLAGLLLLGALPAAVVGFLAPAPCTQHTNARSSLITMAALKAGDRVVVIGSTGGCGQLIAARLADAGKYKVRAIGRSETKLRNVLGSNSGIDFGVADSTNPDSLLAPLSDADCVIIATGTSAFPSPRWKNGNTPDAVDRKGVQNILQAVTSKPRKRPIKKVIFLSSIGVLRTKSLPYSILNLFGVLDAKRDSEDLLKSMAATEDFDYVIVSRTEGGREEGRGGRDVCTQHTILFFQVNSALSHLLPKYQIGATRAVGGRALDEHRRQRSSQGGGRDEEASGD
jgi:hypothetical protein